MAGFYIYIGELDIGVRKSDIERLLTYYGRVKIMSLESDFAIVEFREKEDALDAVYDFHGVNFFCQRLDVRYLGDGSVLNQTKETNRFIVKNLPPGTIWQELKDFVESQGFRPIFASIFADRYGEGLVEFPNHHEMTDAFEKLKNIKMKGQKLRLKKGKIRIRPTLPVIPKREDFIEFNSKHYKSESPKRRRISSDDDEISLHRSSKSQ